MPDFAFVCSDWRINISGTGYSKVFAVRERFSAIRIYAVVKVLRGRKFNLVIVDRMLPVRKW